MGYKLESVGEKRSNRRIGRKMAIYYKLDGDRVVDLPPYSS
jgi:hypothetical protein